jgi:hypothetical protein
MLYDFDEHRKFAISEYLSCLCTVTMSKAFSESSKEFKIWSLRSTLFSVAKYPDIDFTVRGIISSSVNPCPRLLRLHF